MPAGGATAVLVVRPGFEMHVVDVVANCPLQ